MGPVVLVTSGRGSERLLKRGQQSTREWRGAAPLRCGGSVVPAVGLEPGPFSRPVLPAQPRSDTRAPPAAATRDPERGSSPPGEPRGEPGTLLPSSSLSPEEFIARVWLEERRTHSREGGLGSNGRKRGLPRQHTLSPCGRLSVPPLSPCSRGPGCAGGAPQCRRLRARRSPVTVRWRWELPGYRPARRCRVPHGWSSSVPLLLPCRDPREWPQPRPRSPTRGGFGRFSRGGGGSALLSPLRSRLHLPFCLPPPHLYRGAAPAPRGFRVGSGGRMELFVRWCRRGRRPEPQPRLLPSAPPRVAAGLRRGRRGKGRCSVGSCAASSCSRVAPVPGGTASDPRFQRAPRTPTEEVPGRHRHARGCGSPTATETGAVVPGGHDQLPTLSLASPAGPCSRSPGAGRPPRLRFPPARPRRAELACRDGSRGRGVSGVLWEYAGAAERESSASSRYHFGRGRREEGSAHGQPTHEPRVPRGAVRVPLSALPAGSRSPTRVRRWRCVPARVARRQEPTHVPPAGQLPAAALPTDTETASLRGTGLKGCPVLPEPHRQREGRVPSLPTCENRARGTSCLPESAPVSRDSRVSRSSVAASGRRSCLPMPCRGRAGAGSRWGDRLTTSPIPAGSLPVPAGTLAAQPLSSASLLTDSGGDGSNRAWVAPLAPGHLSSPPGPQPGAAGTTKPAAAVPYSAGRVRVAGKDSRSRNGGGAERHAGPRLSVDGPATVTGGSRGIAPSPDTALFVRPPVGGPGPFRGGTSVRHRPAAAEPPVPFPVPRSPVAPVPRSARPLCAPRPSRAPGAVPPSGAWPGVGGRGPVGVATGVPSGPAPAHRDAAHRAEYYGLGCAGAAPALRAAA
ncbi:collagen alpha-1(I) chain-like [Ammospiza caudacuta]|uniref:collagen alpha-1(I) chain-like n=1 Tax=Ammospiza caudacuta TaxID=2857398 RepID=UPI0027386C79|nr:collagen alpha-1(I) chain-like [Ammospiza caudacuta]